MVKYLTGKVWNPWRVHRAVAAHIAVANSITSAGHEQQQITQPVAITEGSMIGANAAPETVPLQHQNGNLQLQGTTTSTHAGTIAHSTQLQTQADRNDRYPQTSNPCFLRPKIRVTLTSLGIKHF
jgi:hypothetical protein